MVKATFTVGVFIGITKPTGEILLRRRVEEDSILPGQSFKGNWELPGGGVMEQDTAVPYDHHVRELVRHIKREVGIDVAIPLALACFHAFPFKGPNGYDLAMVTPLLVSDPPDLDPERFKWASFEEVNELAKAFVAPKKDPPTEGVGLLSGWGKRMHCMALSVFRYDARPSVANPAMRTLEAIQKTW